MSTSTLASTLWHGLSRRAVPLEESPYGYKPGMPNTIAYTVVFSLLTLAHLGVAVRYRNWPAMATMVAGGILEIVGWAGRLWSAKNVLNWQPFIMQTVCLIIGPVFFSAWDYTLLGECIKVLGSRYSLLGPKWYIITFVILDIISLVLQAIGGGGAAVNAQDGQDTTNNTHIMLAGIVFQLGATSVFVALGADFMWRVITNRPYQFKVRAEAARAAKTAEKETSHTNSEVGSTTEPTLDPQVLRKIQYLLAGVCWATLMIYIRGIYRTVELAEGWTGYLITHEVYFIWLDGFMMVLCMAGLLVAHPGWLIPKSARPNEVADA